MPPLHQLRSESRTVITNLDAHFTVPVARSGNLDEPPSRRGAMAYLTLFSTRVCTASGGT